MREFHPDVYLFAVVRALGGTRQDLSVEGAPAILMNAPYYLQFLHWRIHASGGKSDAILQTKLYIMLRSAEVIAMLRVLSILHISICLPTRWLAGKSHELAEYNFGYYDMGKALDSMESAFENVMSNGELIYDEDFMMTTMFGEIVETVDPFREYLEYMWEEKGGTAVGGGGGKDHILPGDELRAALFYPTRSDIQQTNDLCARLGVVCATAFLTEFRDTSKATHNYLSSIEGQYSQAVISEETRKAGLGKEASNSTAESNFASAGQALRDFGTIRLHSAAAHGQWRTNSHCVRDEDHTSLMFQLPKELVQSLFYASKKGAPKLRKRHDSALAILKQAKLDKLKESQAEMAERAVEESIVAMNYYEMGVSDRCWKSATEARRNLEQLTSETAKLKEIKEQILIRRIGFGWEECAHTWSFKDGDTRQNYTSQELMHFMISVVFPLERRRGIPSKPATNYSTSISINYKLESNLQFKDDNINTRSAAELEQYAIEERARREQQNETDLDANLQPSVMPKVDNSLVGFNIEVCFEYDEDDGSTYLAWCDGVVQSVANEKTRVVVIRWNENKLYEGDAKSSRHKLGIRGWNPKNPKSGAWRKFVGDPNA